MLINMLAIWILNTFENWIQMFRWKLLKRIIINDFQAIWDSCYDF